MQAFDFLNDFMQWAAQLAPRWDLLEPTHGGVKFKPWNQIEKLQPGQIYWWWPASTKVRTIPINEGTLVIGQRLTTRDGQAISANIVVVYTVEDVVKAIMAPQDLEENSSVVAQELSIKPLMRREFNEIIRDMAENDEVRKECTYEARKALKRYGLKIAKAYVSDITETTVFSHDGEGLVVSQGDNDDDDE